MILFVPVSIWAQEKLVPLATVVKRAVERDPGVRAHRAEKEAARSEALRVRTMRLPKLYVSTDVGGGQIVNDLANVLLTGLSPASVTDPKTRSRLADLSASRPYFVPGARLEDNLFDGGATSAAIRSATLNESKAEVTGNRAAEDEAFTAASDFLSLAQGRVLSRYLEEYVRVAELVATALEDQAKAGRITVAKALTGQAKLEAARAALENNRDDLLVFSSLLRQRAGLPQDAAFDTRWLESRLSESSLFPLPETLEVEPNSDLQNSSLDARIQEQELRAAKARRIPDVKFVAEYGFSFSALIFTFRPGYDVGLRVNYPLFTSRELERNIQTQQRRLDAANFRREKVATALREDHIRLLAEGRKLGRQYDAAHSALAQAEEVYRVERLKYDQGAGAPGDLLEAADLLSTARQRCLDLTRSSLLLRWTALRSEDALLVELEQGTQP
jgi:outer membrane protein TolC